MKTGKHINSRGPLYWLRTCYGVELRDGGVACVVRATRTTTGVSCVSVPDSDHAFRAHVAAGSAAVAGLLTERESFSRWLVAPFPSATKARQVFPSLLDIQLPFPLDDCVHAFMPVEADADACRCLAVVSRTSDMEKKLNAYRGAGFEPEAMDQEGISLWTQSCREEPVAKNAARVVVSLGGRHATLAVGRGHGFLGAGTVRQGADQFDRILRAMLGESATPIEWAWAGPDAGDGRIVERLRGEIPPGWAGRSFVHKEPASFQARAVAVRALTAGPLRCNLRTGVFEHETVARRRRKGAIAASLSLLAAGIALFCVSLAGDLLTSDELQSLRSSFASTVNGLAGYNVTTKGEQAIKDLEKILRDQLKDSRPFVEAVSPSLMETLSGMARIGKDDGLTLEYVLLRRDSVSVTGTCGGWNECEGLLNWLRDRGFSLKLDRKSSADGRIRFSIGPGGGGV